MSTLRFHNPLAFTVRVKTEAHGSPGGARIQLDEEMVPPLTSKLLATPRSGLGVLTVWDGASQQLWRTNFDNPGATPITMPYQYRPQHGNMILHKQSGHALDGDGRSLYFHERNDGDYQKWVFVDGGGDGTVFLLHLLSGKVLDGDGEDLYFHPFNGGIFQKWRVLEDEDGYFTLEHLQSNKVLDGDGAYLYFYDKNDGDNQKWKKV